MSSTRVSFDCEIFVRQSFGGISRYFSEIIANFRSDPDLGVVPLLGFSRCSNIHLREVLASSNVTLSPLQPSLRGLNRLANGPDSIKDGFLTYRAGRSSLQRVDILHATYLRPRSKDRIRSKFLVATIQDLIAEHLDLPSTHPARRGKAQLVTQADLIITTTHTNANEIGTRWPGCNIQVIPLGVDVHFFANPLISSSLIPFPYFLHVGGRGGYKNFNVVPKAISLLRTRYDVGLVCVGPSMTAIELNGISELATAGRFTYIQASDEQLATLYRDSLGLIFPSLMEGFGLPVLEAAAAGCPAILSEIPPFKELGGDWAMFFEATSPESLSLTLEKALSSPRSGIAPPDAVSRLPTWTDVTHEHAAAYRTLTS
jgi:glycosyltransferase involved in cell wall biosynthesis